MPPAHNFSRRIDWHEFGVNELRHVRAEPLPIIAIAAEELAPGVQAYVFVTNVGFHRRLNEIPNPAAAPFGLGMPDFNKPGTFRVTEIYRRKQKHIDAHNIGSAFLEYTKFPSTFDGTLPSEAFGAPSSRVKIGETYFFNNVGEKAVLGTVTYASVNESEKSAYIAVATSDGTSQILQQPMTDSEFADYKTHPDAYFGKILPVSKRIDDPYELFEWFMNANKGLSRTVILERLSNAPNLGGLRQLSDSDLLGAYCEGLVAATPASSL